MDFKALGAAAAAAGADQTKVTTGGGGDYTPPAAGPASLRFVAYIEVGKQKKKVQGKEKIQNEVHLAFELSGRNHPPTVLDDGTKRPHIIWLKENLSLNEKARFKKLFARMNYKGEAQHLVQLLGEAFRGDVIHRTWKGADGKERTEAELYNKAEGTFTIRAPRSPILDEETGEDTGEFRVIKVDPPITPVKAFLWEHCDMDQWNSLFIDGEWPERKDDKGVVTAPAKSKNVLQNRIKLAVNFKGSPMYNLLATNGGSLDIPDAESGVEEDDGSTDDDTAAAAGVAASVGIAKAGATAAAPKGAAADDALNGIA